MGWIGIAGASRGPHVPGVVPAANAARPPGISGVVFKRVLPILLGAMLAIGGLIGGGLGLAHGDDDVMPAQGPQCESGSLADFTRALAAAAAGSLSQVETALGVSVESVGQEGPGAVGEYRAQPLPGSTYETMIQGIDVRVDPQQDTITALVATMRPDVCYSMPSVTEQFGEAEDVDIPPIQTGKAMALRYPIGGQTMSFGFGPSPDYRLVSVSVLL